MYIRTYIYARSENEVISGEWAHLDADRSVGRSVARKFLLTFKKRVFVFVFGEHHDLVQEYNERGTSWNVIKPELPTEHGWCQIMGLLPLLSRP